MAFSSSKHLAQPTFNYQRFFAPPNFNPNHSWIELDEKAFLQNVATLRSILKSKTLSGMTKGNAYGIGLINFIKMSHGVIDSYSSLDAEEAFQIRKYEKELKLNPKRIIAHDCEASELLECVKQDIEIVIIDIDFFKSMQSVIALCPSPVKVNIFINTGMNREGIDLTEVPQAIAAFSDKLEIQGVLTHFIDGANEEITRWQMECFDKAYELIKNALAPNRRLEKSVGSSASTLSLLDLNQDQVRIGTSLIHGVWPSDKTQENAKKLIPSIELMPVLSWRCQTSNIKKIPANGRILANDETMEYIELKQEITVALFQIGSAAGYCPAESAEVYVLIKGIACKVLAVDMNYFSIDVTNVAQPGETIIATLIGKDGSKVLSVEKVVNGLQAYGSHLALFVIINQNIPRFIIPADNQPVLAQSAVNASTYRNQRL
jgi:alanine racemase